MKYLAKYLHRRGENPPYYRTVFGDNVNDAMKQAERYTRKGFLCVGVTTNMMEDAYNSIKKAAIEFSEYYIKTVPSEAAIEFAQEYIKNNTYITIGIPDNLQTEHIMLMERGTDKMLKKINLTKLLVKLKTNEESHE